LNKTMQRPALLLIRAPRMPALSAPPPPNHKLSDDDVARCAHITRLYRPRVIRSTHDDYLRLNLRAIQYPAIHSYIGELSSANLTQVLMGNIPVRPASSFVAGNPLSCTFTTVAQSQHVQGSPLRTRDTRLLEFRRLQHDKEPRHLFSRDSCRLSCRPADLLDSKLRLGL
jgi:hypothetical protein